MHALGMRGSKAAGASRINGTLFYELEGDLGLQYLPRRRIR